MGARFLTPRERNDKCGKGEKTRVKVATGNTGIAHSFNICKEIHRGALTSVAQVVGHRPAK